MTDTDQSPPPPAPDTGPGRRSGGRRPRRLLRRVLVWTGGVLLALVLLVIGAVVLIGRTDAGLAWLKDTIVDAVNDPAGLGLALDALDGPLPERLSLRGVQLSDPDGVWLTAETLVVAWDPLALLGGKVVVEVVEGQRIDVVRAPNLPPSAEEEEAPSEGGAFDPRLLGLLELDRLEIRGLHLGAALAGVDAGLDITGTLSPTADNATRAALTIVRTDGVASTIALEATAGGAPLALDLDLTVEEPAGGLVASLAGLPGTPPVAVSLTGSGPLESWAGILRAEAQGLATIDGGLTLALPVEGGPIGLTTDLTFTAGPDVPAEVAAVTGGPVSVVTDVIYGEDGGITLNRVDVGAGAWGLAASGGMGADGALALTARADLLSAAPIAAFVPDLLLSQAHLGATVQGTVSAPEGAVSLTLDGLDMPGTVTLDHLDLEAAVTPDDDAGDGAMRLVAKVRPRGLSLSAAGPEADAILGGAPQLDAVVRTDTDFRTVRLDSLTLAGQAIRLEATASVGLEAMTLDGTRVTVTLPDLATVGEALGRPMTGAVDLHVAADGAHLNPPSGSADLSLAARDLSIDAGGPADSLLGPSPRLEGRVTQGDDGGLLLETLTLAAAGATLDGSGRLSADGDVDASLHAALADLGLLAPDMSGAPQLSVRLSGPVADPTVSASVRADRLVAGGITADDLAVTAMVGTLTSGPAGLVDLSGQVGGVPLTGHVPFAMDAGYAGIDVWDAGLTLAEATVALETRVDLPADGSPVMDGTVTLSMPDLGVVAAVGGPPMTGALSGTVDFDPPEGEQAQTIRVDLTAPRLAMAGQGAPSLGRVTVKGSVADPFAAPRMDLTVASGQGSAAPVLWSRLTVAVKGGLEALGITTRLNGALALGSDPGGDPVTKPLDVAVDAKVALAGAGAGAGPTVTLTTLTVDLADKDIRLGRPATLSLAGGGAKVDRLLLGIEDGSLELTGGLVPGGGYDLALAIRRLPLTLIEPFAPDAGLTGAIALDVTLKGPRSGPQGGFQLRAPRIDATAVPGVPLSLDVDGQIQPRGGLAVEARVGDFGGTPAVASVVLPLRFGADGVPALTEGGALSGRVTWSGPIEGVWQFVPMVGHRLTGPADVAVTIGGTVANPNVTGRVAMDGVRYENLEQGTVLEDLRLQADVGADQQLRLRLTGTDGSDGSLKVVGTVNLADLTTPVGDVQVNITNATLVRRDDVTASLDADMSLEMGGDGMAVRGTVTTRKVDVLLVDTMRASVPELEVVEVGLPGQEQSVERALEVRAKARADAAPALPIDLDLTVNLPGPVTVRGQGVDMEWSGSLKVSGTADQPRVVGSLTAKRSSVEAMGKTFLLRTGVVRFDGGRRIDPILDIVLAHDTGDIIALVNVEGPVSAMDISFSSEPMLPEDEVISQVMFGKTSGQLTPFEAVQLAEVAANLAGLGSSGPGFTDRLRSAVGLDVLRLGGDSEAGTGSTVEAGAYIADGVYVGVEQGLGPGSSAVEVQVELTDDFSVETKAGASGDGEVGVYYKFDY